MSIDPSAITFFPSSWESNQHHVARYIAGIAVPYDDFLEDFILSSEIYVIHAGGEDIGFFGVHEDFLTILYVEELHFRLANAILEKIIAETGVKEAFVPTTDLAFLSVALEKHSEVKIQALHFMDTKRAVRPAEFGREALRLAARDDLDAITAMAEVFLEEYEEMIDAGQLYVLEDGEDLLGLGVTVDNRIMPDCVGTGMFAREDRRGEGIGRSILLHLKEMVYEQGKTPVPGCWYYNTASRRTLESAGYITVSKLLRIVF